GPFNLSNCDACMARTMRGRVSDPSPHKTLAQDAASDVNVVTGSGSGLPGTYARINSKFHCGRTSKFHVLAGTTTASPLAKVTGSVPWSSTTPQPFSVTRI